MRRPVFWVLFFGLAASVFGWETYHALTATSLHAVPPAAGVAQSPIPGEFEDNGSRASDLGLQVARIVARPLFRVDRQPFKETTPDGVQRNHDADLARFSLIGIVQLGETMKGIVVGTNAGARSRWEVARGDSLQGFTVKGFQADTLILTADGKEYPLRMYTGGPKGQAGSLRTEVPVASAREPAKEPATAASPAALQPDSAPPGGKPSPGAEATQLSAPPPFALRGANRPPLRIPGR